jgi:hypothetical protein
VADFNGNQEGLLTILQLETRVRRDYNREPVALKLLWVKRASFSLLPKFGEQGIKRRCAVLHTPPLFSGLSVR